MNNQNNKSEKVQTPKPQDKKPNEFGGFYFSSFLKISDPNTKQVILQKRGDN